MPRVSDMYPSKWLAASDIPDEGQVFAVANLDYELVGEDQKYVLYFEGVSKGLVLNKTNSKTIQGLYGDDTDDWIGQLVTLFPTQVDFQGKTVDAIRVRNRKPKSAKVRKKVEMLTQAEADKELDNEPDPEDIPY